MARHKDYPYSQFNFLVEWEGMDGTTTQAGFQEVSGLGMEIAIAEYRSGKSATNEPIKITGLAKTPDVTLKRGVMGALDLFTWIDAVRNGSQEQGKNVRITLLSETQEHVLRWVLKTARPMKYTGPALNGKGADVAIEELTLSVERIEMEAA